MKTVLFC